MAENKVNNLNQSYSKIERVVRRKPRGLSGFDHHKGLPFQPYSEGETPVGHKSLARNINSPAGSGNFI